MIEIISGINFLPKIVILVMNIFHLIISIVQSVQKKMTINLLGKLN